MNDRTIKKAQKLPPLPDRMARAVRKHGVITGSRVFGGFVPEKSDIDVILLPAELGWGWDEIMTERCGWYQSGEYYESEYQAIYVKVPYSKHIHNLLLMRDSRSYQRWVDATRWMVQMKKEIPEMVVFFKDKGKRIEMFEMLKMWEG